MPDPSRSDEEAREIVQACIDGWASISGSTNFDHPQSSTSLCTSATFENVNSPATATWEFVVPGSSSGKIQYINNPLARTVHGGAIATFFDNLTSMTMMLVRNPWDDAGVSRCLNVTYYRPVVEGEKVVMFSEVVHSGRRLGTVRGELRRKSDGAVLAMCLHEKANPDVRVANI